MNRLKYPKGFHLLIIAVLVFVIGLMFLPNFTIFKIWDDLDSFYGYPLKIEPRLINVYRVEASKTFVYLDIPNEGIVTFEHIETGQTFTFNYILHSSSTYVATHYDSEYFSMSVGKYAVLINVIAGSGVSINVYTIGFIIEEYSIFIYLLFFGGVCSLFYKAYRKDPTYYRVKLKQTIRNQLFTADKERLRVSKLEKREKLEYPIVKFLFVNKDKAFSAEVLQYRINKLYTDFLSISKKDFKGILDKLVLNKSIALDIHEGIKCYLNLQE